MFFKQHRRDKCKLIDSHAYLRLLKRPDVQTFINVILWNKVAKYYEEENQSKLFTKFVFKKLNLWTNKWWIKIKMSKSERFFLTFNQTFIVTNTVFQEEWINNILSRMSKNRFNKYSSKLFFQIIKQLLQYYFLYLKGGKLFEKKFLQTKKLRMTRRS